MTTKLFARLSWFLLFLPLVLVACSSTNSSPTTKTTPNNSTNNEKSTAKMNTTPIDESKLSQATIGGGCFWCVEAVFQDLRGVQRVESGYAGGSVKNPTYKAVCEGTTGHAEVVRIYFDSTQISYEQLLEVFFQTHDPTTLNRQGGDEGTQYRSVIFYHNDEQRQTAEKMRLKAKEWWDDPIVTELAPMGDFYEAEEYHQDYFERDGGKNPYCSAVISPKIAKSRKLFTPLLKDEIKVK